MNKRVANHFPVQARSFQQCLVGDEVSVTSSEALAQRICPPVDERKTLLMVQMVILYLQLLIEGIVGRLTTDQG